jgi:hypothetical protein
MYKQKSLILAYRLEIVMHIQLVLLIGACDEASHHYRGA